MEAVIRSPFQGVCNIIRFNWPFFLFSAAGVALIGFAYPYLPDNLKVYWYFSVFTPLFAISASLTTSYYIYDYSGLYQLRWLAHLLTQESRILNIHAGFDETSTLIKHKFPGIEIEACDFYDPTKHTEASIRRARATYPAFPGTRSIVTSSMPAAERSVDFVLAIFSLHEIRDREERIAFMKNITNCLRPNGKIIVVEHRRDLANFLAYTIGFLHFLSASEWDTTFHNAGLYIEREIKLNPFITCTILTR